MHKSKYNHWIWTSEWNIWRDENPAFVLFRKEIEYREEPAESKIRISADSRYKLYINEKLVEVGPSKGDQQVWYYDEIDITSYLLKGRNVIAVMVLRYPMNPMGRNQSVVGTVVPGLYLSGEGYDQGNHYYDFSADDSFKCKIDDRIHIVAENQGFSPLHIYECMKETKEMQDWKAAGFDDKEWKSARLYQSGEIRDAVSPGNLLARTIPFMYRKQGQFCRVMSDKESHYTKDSWMKMLKGTMVLKILPHTKEIVELDAGEEMTGYLQLEISKGTGSQIRILQSEAYVLNQGKTKNGCFQKADRQDVIHGHLEGYEDIYYTAGSGTADKLECYEPFWFRTFRFVRLQIQTEEETLYLHQFKFVETGYPLKIKTKVWTSDSSLIPIWDISQRTLRRCMHETYEDCPFYEQLQYVMDSRSQILYTYATAADDRLARKCMDDFKRSQRYDGLLCSAYPNTKPNVIPGFSIFYVLMLHDHMMYFGDHDFIRYHMPSVEQVLNFFDTHRSQQGYVNKIGGFHRQEKFWSFIDWAPQWHSGVPGASEHGAVTMESLLYIMGLLKAADLAAFLGRNELAQEYHNKAKNMREAVRQYCTGVNGLIQDGPGISEYSQHCQVFAILTEVVDREQGKKNLRQTLEESNVYAQCSVSMSLYLFEALQKSDLYEYTDQCWNVWREMVANNMTTCAESKDYARSECHAWGALILYELPAVVLGVGPAAPGFQKIRISPNPGYLNSAKGNVITPHGMVTVSWQKKGQKLQVDYEVPEGLEVVLEGAVYWQEEKDLEVSKQIQP